MTDIRIKNRRYIKDEDDYTQWSDPNELYRVDCMEFEVIDGKIWLSCWKKTPHGMIQTSHHISFDTDEAISIEIGNFQED